ncbi:unnamed protein product [Caenorhabditis angaria]|uniref:Uncharacterized protein n=1 Tax=Caenorhabditis angaria TaxID=860376 RepID=A0A9P1N0C5_9PELO|nr:unnamed protein product [Caenorhabditis angaria]
MRIPQIALVIFTILAIAQSARSGKPIKNGNGNNSTSAPKQFPNPGPGPGPEATQTSKPTTPIKTSSTKTKPTTKTPSTTAAPAPTSVTPTKSTDAPTSTSVETSTTIEEIITEDDLNATTSSQSTNATTASTTVVLTSPPTTAPPIPATTPKPVQNGDLFVCSDDPSEQKCEKFCEKRNMEPGVTKDDNYETPTYFWICLIFLVLFFIATIVAIYFYSRYKRQLNLIRGKKPVNEILLQQQQQGFAPKEQDAKELFDEKDEKKSGGKAKKFDKNDPATRERHRRYIQQCKQQELEDGDLRNFAKSGTIFIPHAVNDAAFTKKCEAPDNIQLERVFYDPSGNEVFDIGSDVDNIELNPSTVGTSENDTSKLSAETKSSASRSKIKTTKSKAKDKSLKSG